MFVKCCGLLQVIEDNSSLNLVKGEGDANTEDFRTLITLSLPLVTPDLKDLGKTNPMVGKKIVMTTLFKMKAF